MKSTNTRNRNTTPTAPATLFSKLLESAPAALNGPITAERISIRETSRGYAVDAFVGERRVSAVYVGTIGLDRLHRLIKSVAAQNVGKDLTLPTATLKARTRTVNGTEYLDLDA